MLTDDEVRVNIANSLSQLLIDRGWSKSELARRTGDPLMTISNICNGKCVAKSGVLSRIAKAFGVSIDQIARRKVAVTTDV